MRTEQEDIEIIKEKWKEATKAFERLQWALYEMDKEIKREPLKKKEEI